MKSNELRFLLVDDEAPIRELSGRFLQVMYKGCTVEELDNGAGLVNYKGKSHLYIVDNRMPQMWGLDAIDIRRAQGDNTPILFSSGTPQDFQQKGLPNNTVFLKKPYNFTEFRQSVEAIISEHYGQIEKV